MKLWTNFPFPFGSFSRCRLSINSENFENYSNVTKKTSNYACIPSISRTYPIPLLASISEGSSYTSKFKATATAFLSFLRRIMKLLIF